jgi:hypothetical protein
MNAVRKALRIKRSACFNATGDKMGGAVVPHGRDKKPIENTGQEISREDTVWRNWVQMGG